MSEPATDDIRRYTRRGVARAVLEHQGDANYMESHPIADEFSKSHSIRNTERLARERNPAGGTGKTVVSMSVKR